MTPYTKELEGTRWDLPCGKCPYCVAKRVSNWSFRLMQEERISSSAFFITLTYDPKYVPITEKGFMTLCKRDVQLFMKRLRKENKEKLKYYLCGEYGSKTGRPHYHIILFNARIETIQGAWNRGQVHYGIVQEASVGYTLKYIAKLGRIPLHENDDRQKEFSLMSKGIGINYVQNVDNLRWHKADLLNRMYVNIKGGKKAPMPRYFKEKIYTKEELGDLKAKWTEEHRLIKEEAEKKPDFYQNLLSYEESIKHQFQKMITKYSKRENYG